MGKQKPWVMKNMRTAVNQALSCKRARRVKAPVIVVDTIKPQRRATKRVKEKEQIWVCCEKCNAWDDVETAHYICKPCQSTLPLTIAPSIGVSVDVVRQYMLDIVLGPELHKHMTPQAPKQAAFKIKAPFPPSFHAVVFGTLDKFSIETYEQAHRIFGEWAVKMIQNCSCRIAPETVVWYRDELKKHKLDPTKEVHHQMTYINVRFKFFNQNGILQFPLGTQFVVFVRCLLYAGDGPMIDRLQDRVVVSVPRQ